jgi:uncharacterized protein with PIN domain
MAIRFHLDEHIADSVAAGLRVGGVDVTTSAEVALLGRDDEDQLAFAASQGRVLVTHDHGFTRMDAAGISHCGICYCHRQKHSIGSLLKSLLLIHQCLDESEMNGRLEYL